MALGQTGIPTVMRHAIRAVGERVMEETTMGETTMITAIMTGS